MLKRWLVPMALILSTTGCYVHQTKLSDPLNPTKKIAPLNWAWVHLSNQTKDKTGFYKLYKQELTKDIQKSLHLTRISFSPVRPEIKTLEGFPPRFYRSLKQDEVDLFTTGSVYFKSMIIENRNSLTQSKQGPNKIHMTLEVELHFWSTTLEKKLKTHSYKETGMALLTDKVLLKSQLIERVNRRLLKAFQPEYKND